MVGVVIITHGDLAEALVTSAAMLVGEGAQMAYASIHPGDDPGDFYARVAQRVEEVDKGDGVVALVDLYGGTPSNTVVRMAAERNIRVLTGVNLPMVIYAILERTAETSQEELMKGLISASVEGVKEFAVQKTDGA